MRLERSVCLSVPYCSFLNCLLLHYWSLISPFIMSPLFIAYFSFLYCSLIAPLLIPNCSFIDLLLLLSTLLLYCSFPYCFLISHLLIPFLVLKKEGCERPQYVKSYTNINSKMGLFSSSFYLKYKELMSINWCSGTVLE